MQLEIIENKPDLNFLFVHNPEATYFIQVAGHSMNDVGIFDGDILIVDRSLSPGNNSIVVAILEKELVVRRLCYIKDTIYLAIDNPHSSPIPITPEIQFEVFGTVIHSIHSFKK